MLDPVFSADGIELYQGDSLLVLPELPAGSADLIVTDPPYSSGGLYRGDRSKDVSEKYSDGSALAGFSGDNRDQRAFAYWVSLWCSELLRIAKPSASLLVFTDWRQIGSLYDAVQAGGWVLRGLPVWNKTAGRARPRRGGFRAQAEFVVWATAGAVNEWDGAPCVPGVLQSAGMAAQKRTRVAQKPEDVLRQMVSICPPDGCVLDPFAGTGTTLLAAHALGRKAIGIELEPQTVDDVARALRARTAQRNLFTGEGA